MINHITLRVSNFEKSKEFFTRALKPLGYKARKKEKDKDPFFHGQIAGFCIENLGECKRDFWIKAGGKKQHHHSFSCLAFTATSKKMVNDFYRAALEAGGKDNGPPGYREKYHPRYYAAYVLDPDGHNIEVVFDEPHPINE